jgi:hypothetical protein
MTAVGEDAAAAPAAQMQPPEPEPEPVPPPAAQNPMPPKAKGRKKVVCGALKKLPAAVTKSQLAMHLAVLDSDAALLASQSPIAGSLPSPAEPAVAMVQPQAYSNAMLGIVETNKLVRSVAARVHHCDELLDMLTQEAEDPSNAEQRFELEETHRELSKRLSKHRSVLLRAAEAMGHGDEVAELLHHDRMFPPPPPPQQGQARAATKSPGAARRQLPRTPPTAPVVGPDAEGGGRRWSPSPPPRYGSRSGGNSRLPIGSAESFAARPHTASSGLRKWRTQNPSGSLKFDTRPRNKGLAPQSARTVAEEVSVSGWRLDESTSYVLPLVEQQLNPPSTPGGGGGGGGAGEILASLALDPGEMEQHRRSQRTGSWRGPRASPDAGRSKGSSGGGGGGSGGRRRRKGGTAKEARKGGADCAPWQMALQDNADRAAEAEEAEAKKERALSKIGFRNGEPMLLSMPHPVTLHWADDPSYAGGGGGGGGGDDGLVELGDGGEWTPQSFADDAAGEESVAKEADEIVGGNGAAGGGGTPQVLQQLRQMAPERSYSKSNLLTMYEEVQARQRGDLSPRFLPESELRAAAVATDDADAVAYRTSGEGSHSPRWGSPQPPPLAQAQAQAQTQAQAELSAPLSLSWAPSVTETSPSSVQKHAAAAHEEARYRTSTPTGVAHHDGSVRVRATSSMEQCWAVQDYLSGPTTRVTARMRAAGVAATYPYDGGCGRPLSGRGSEHDMAPQRQRCLSRAEQIQCGIRLRPTAHGSATQWPTRPSRSLAAAVALA